MINDNNIYPYPVIVVPGVQGCHLEDQYPVRYKTEWTGMLNRSFGHLHLSPIDDGVDEEATRLIHPGHAVPLVYEHLIDRLRADVTPYTYVFTYDWRRDIREIAKKLSEDVKIILRKMKVEARKKGVPPPQKVSFVAHSMGGLIVKWYLDQILKEKADDKIDKIITLGTPYKGSLKAVEAILPGAENFFGWESDSSMRKASRTLPSVYQLLPTWEGAVVDKHTGELLDIFDPATWQTNLLERMKKIAELARDPKFFEKKLENAREFSKIISQDYPPNIAAKFYCIYGIGSNTWQSVVVDTRNGNWFEFDRAVVNDFGDGTVHQVSSCAGKGITIKETKGFLELIPQHIRLPRDADVKNHIVRILTGSKIIKSFQSTI